MPILEQVAGAVTHIGQPTQAHASSHIEEHVDAEVDEAEGPPDDADDLGTRVWVAGQAP